ncbi:uncharacterized protein LOC143303631 [Bombus vancouverensis nearcticus]|uniref:uncharacterized protein LOC143303631 n=1 Tax=Bombus vancouverensis nearcticus TaxID=2705178 RepID=UPI00402B52AB
MCMTLKSKNHCFSWIEVLEVAMEFMKENGIDASIRQIILMFDFNQKQILLHNFKQMQL